MHIHNRFATRSGITSAAVFVMTNTFLTGIPQRPAASRGPDGDDDHT